MPDDFDLLTAWRRGDRAAGSELFARHFGAVFGFFRSKVEHVAEDLTQQTFLACVEARDDFRGTANFSVYLFVIARNMLYGHLRRKANRTADPDFEVTSLADLDPSPSGLLVFREQPLPLPRAVAERLKAAVGLAGVRESLALAKIDLQQPLTRPSLP